MKIQRLILLCCLIFSIQGSALLARELEKYKSEVTVPILENDTVYARNNALQTLQNLLLTAAIKDLIGQELYAEFSYELSRNRNLRPSMFLVSAKVLKERSENNYFTMELEGIIQTSALADELHKMNLVLKDDPWISVTVILESGMKIAIGDLKNRLDLFHIKLAEYKSVKIDGIAFEDRSSVEFSEVLFSQFPRSKIIYFIDAQSGGGFDSVNKIRTQVFRRSDNALISTFQFDIPNPVAADSIDEATINRYLRLFNLSSLETGLYNEGLESTIQLKVEGLIDPFNRNAFEEKILEANRSIKSYTLVQLSADTAEYQLQTNYSLEELSEMFNRKSPYFYFITEKASGNVLKVESFYRYPNRPLELQEWEPVPEILELISEALKDKRSQPESSGAGNMLLQNPVRAEFIPQFVEREPNNNSQNLNRVPPSTLVLGYISSRADEDVFQLNRNVESSTLVVEWIRIGKTTLSPQIRLYDNDFSFINNYNLVGQQDKLRFLYTFKQTAPHKVFLRVTDRVGYIQGETGGFKNFHYLLKYYWQTSNQIIKSTF